MKIGVHTNGLVGVGFSDLEEIADWAAENELPVLELGPTIDLDMAKIEKVQSEGKVRIDSFIYCRNFLLEDEGEYHRKELLKRIELAGRIGARKVITSTGIDRGIDMMEKFDFHDAIRKRPIRSLDKVEDFLTTVLNAAEKANVQICLETCPTIGNIAISPYLLEKIFERIPNERLGIAYDPSHLIWEMLDPYDFILRFRDKIYHVHGKDTEVNNQRLAETGILSDFSWWRYRLPGLGTIDWTKFMSRLMEIGYDDVIDIEYDDPVWCGSEDRVKKGYLIARDTLRQAMHA